MQQISDASSGGTDAQPCDGVQQKEQKHSSATSEKLTDLITLVLVVCCFGCQLLALGGFGDGLPLLASCHFSTPCVWAVHQ